MKFHRLISIPLEQIVTQRLSWTLPRAMYMTFASNSFRWPSYHFKKDVFLLKLVHSDMIIFV